MSAKKETIVLGAGLSGMTAAIILAKNDRKVKVIERANDIGGDLSLHPSLHATPINIEKVRSWTGLDTDKMFTMGKYSRTFIGKDSFELPPMYLIERGKRPTSIDTYLYDEAKKLGVEFEFNRHVKDPDDLPKGSIIATGFHPDMFNAFKTPARTARGFFKMAKKTDPELQGTMYLWMGPYSEDYAYACIINDLLYIALFSRFGLPDESLPQFEKHLKESTGWEFDNWIEEGTLPMPCASFQKPRLWVDDYILTGTVGSNMDPMLGFGIHGAILSGVIAAWAVTDPEKAEREYKKLNHFYRPSFLTFEISKSMPFRENFFKMILKYPKMFYPITGFISKGLPGYDKNWVKEIFGMRYEAESA